MKKNILIICGQFIPYTRSFGNSIRLFSFGETLSKKHNVNYIFTGNRSYSYYGFKSNCKKFRLNLVKNYNLFVKFYFLFFKFFFPKFSYLLAIDYGKPYFNQILKKTYLIIEKKKIDHIIISAPPFSFFRISKYIKKKYGEDIKITLDYRDGWGSRIQKNNYFYNLLKLLSNEKYYLKICDSIVCATETIYKEIKNINFKKKLLIKNGFLKIKNNLIKNNRNKKLTIGYFGLISDHKKGYRDINILYDNIYKDKYLCNNIIFKFYGNNNILDKKILNFKSFKFYQNLNYINARKKMMSMDFLMLIHTEKETAKEVITGKFYDYISSRVPIISISNGEIEANRIIKKYKLGKSLNYDKQNLSDFFYEILNKKIKVKNIKINKFSRDYQNRKLNIIV